MVSGKFCLFDIVYDPRVSDFGYCLNSLPLPSLDIDFRPFILVEESFCGKVLLSAVSSESACVTSCSA